MGQSVSSGNIPSIFTWSSDSPRSASSSSNEFRDCRRVESVDEETEDRQLRKNFNSFSCFRSYDTSDDTVEVKIIETQSQNIDKNVNEDMPSSKKCYNFCNGDNIENSEHCADNPSLCNQNMQSSRNDSLEINGNQTSPIQSCSFVNSELQKRGGTSTSINRYVTAFTDMSLDDESKDSSGFRNVAGKSNECKRTPKQKKNNFRECNGCSKEPKNNNKLGAKKKSTWMRFYGSKLGKGSNTKLPTNPTTSSSSSDVDSACVCTSYKKVDDNKQESELDSDVLFPWKPDTTNGNQSTSNWSLVTGTSNMLYNIPSRGNDCISCEGSHCHLEWNAIADLSNIRRLPINITVTRVGPTPGSQNPGSGENNLILLSLGSQRPFDSRMRSDENQIEDCDVRARLRRAFEIDEGIEIPSSVFNSPQFQVVSPEELRALLFQQQIPASATFIDRATPQHGRIHTQVDYIHCLVPDLRSITGCSFYWGKMDRYEAERLLDGKPEGTFLLRDSAQEEYLFSVSFRKYQRSLHARIEQFNHKFSFDSHDPAVFASETVTGLIEHYKDPTCVMFFEPMLTAPLSRTFTFPLQHLCRAVIVSCTTYDGINELRLPQGIKAYLKEYHYRQRVRVKRFDVSPESSEESQ